MKKALILFMFFVVCMWAFLGCSTTQNAQDPFTSPMQALVDWSKFDQAAMKAVVEGGDNWAMVWPPLSGFIRTALGSDIKRLPMETLEAMDELDKISCRIDTDKENPLYPPDFPACKGIDKRVLSQYEKGGEIGLRLLAMRKAVFEALRIFAPDVFNALPLIITGAIGG